MTRLAWDKVDERFYETGIDRGVLYLPSSPGVYDFGVPWNGLSGVEEDFGDDSTTPLYFDGIKYLDTYSFGDALFKLTAYTYPDEFPVFEGVDTLGDGLYLDDQRPQVFAMCYRTRIGNGIDTDDYKIHILYNLTAVADTTEYATFEEVVQPITFEWTMAGKPEHAPGYQPTAYVIFDSRYLSPDLLIIIEDILYGTDTKLLNVGSIDGYYPDTIATDELDGGNPDSPGPEVVDGNLLILEATDPHLPSLPELIEIVKNLRPQIITPKPVSGLSELDDGTGDLTPTDHFGIFVALPTTRLVPSPIDGLYTLAWPREAP